MKINSLPGTKDYLPKEVQIREFIQNTILQIYQENGFERIQTPLLEEISNLEKSEGGDNLNLMFKVLKRGEKLTRAIEEGSNKLADMGLRYDLTLPLSRYYANNREQLSNPFRCIQIDRAYRAERPQKGRMREFVQCDIDIIGTNSYYAEVELMDTTAKALLALGFSDFQVKINDRRILKAVLLECGFLDQELSGVCIILDKLDKVGVNGVQKELEEKSYHAGTIEKLMQLLEQMPITIDEIARFCKDTEAVDNLKNIITLAEKLGEKQYEICYDFSLVRGQGYYTGTIFEVVSNEFKGAIAGGGRYDNLIGKFLKESIPAVGFSIGFERIYQILEEKGISLPNSKRKMALVFEKDTFLEAKRLALRYQEQYQISLFEKPKKLSKWLNHLQGWGYDGFGIYETDMENKEQRDEITWKIFNN